MFRAHLLLFIARWITENTRLHSCIGFGSILKKALKQQHQPALVATNHVAIVMIKITASKKIASHDTGYLLRALKCIPYLFD